MKDETIAVYHDSDRNLLHLQGPNPGTPYTACGLDAALLRKEERSITLAGIWCTKCMRYLKDDND